MRGPLSTTPTHAWRDPVAVAARTSEGAAGIAFHETNGIRMCVLEAGRGRPVILLHGLGWDHSLWGRTIGRLRRRYRVIAADTRGHGRSSNFPGPYSMESLRDDWLGLLDRLGIDDACLVGMSLGGMIAMLMAIERPKRVAALVLAGTACRTPLEARPHMEARIAMTERDGPEPAARLAASQVFSAGFRGSHPDVIEEFVAWRANMDQEPLFATIRATYGFAACGSLELLEMPCLVVAGAEDKLIAPETTAEIARRIRGARYEVVAGCGHMIPIERPAEFESMLDQFLDEHYPG